MKREVLRKIYRSVAEEGVWGYRTDQELREIHKGSDLVSDIAKRTFGYFRHMIRTDQIRVAKSIFKVSQTLEEM
jgi:hypothetical protein